jgi:type IV pilus assembly protein PilE
MNTLHTLLQRPTRRSFQSGFSLLEILFSLSVLGILSSVAYPAFSSTLAAARRSDALVALMTVQAAQERFRANHDSYAELSQLGLGSTSAAGHYGIVVESASTTGYSVRAAAVGAQRRDTACRQLRLTMDGLNLTYASGETESTSNPSAVNRRCWSQ